MDWTKQNEEMLNAWTQAQTKMWEAFSESVSNFGKSPGEKVWDQTLAAGEELVKDSLAAQVEWVKTWAENLKTMEGLPTGAVDALNQFREMTEKWATTQEKLWGTWFDMIKKFNPNQFSGTWGNMPNDPFQVWQESTKQVMDTQMEWMRTWMNQFSGDKED